jgi:hypothetical protein
MHLICPEHRVIRASLLGFIDAEDAKRFREKNVGPCWRGPCPALVQNVGLARAAILVTRERICINGLWRWQPAADTASDARAWFRHCGYGIRS